MRFAVIDGDADWSGPSRPSVRMRETALSAEDVALEARRRLRAIRLDEWRVREFVTGHPMPDEVRHYAMQVEFAAQAIGRLVPIPRDFDSDIYWPEVRR